MRIPACLAVLVALVLALAGCQPTSAPAGGSRTLAGTDIRGLYRLPGTMLTDTAGAPTPLSATTPLTVVFFGYANCPDVCTGTIADLVQARNRLSEADRKDTRLVVVTTDPARDTPAAWGAYLDRLDPAIVGLTGPLADIVAAGNAVGVPIEQGTKLPSGGYEVDHGTQVLVFGRDGGSLLVWTQGKTIGDMKSDLEHLLKEER